MRKTLTLTAALVAVSAMASGALAFHDGGVAECAGCHTMHNSQDGALITDDGGHEYLLKAANSTDTCLSCHAGYGQMAGGAGYGPGGDFYWLTKTFTWTSHGHAAESTGDSHGHNVVSPAYSVLADATLLTAPGGDFNSSYMSCTSCHDPHGNQAFRILYGDSSVFGVPDGPLVGGTRVSFDNPAPLAKGNSRVTIPGTNTGEETNAKHTVYKNGMSDWCANCHPDMHSDITNNFVHPTGENLGSTVAAAYNAYISSDDVQHGVLATAYFGLVPFEIVNVDLATVDTKNYTTGPSGVDQVMCLTCHRAHASAYPDMGRWDFGETFLEDSHPQATDGGADPSDIDNKDYDYTFVLNQRSLCNKCHVKDAGDAPY